MKRKTTQEHASKHIFDLLASLPFTTSAPTCCDCECVCVLSSSSSSSSSEWCWCWCFCSALNLIPLAAFQFYYQMLFHTIWYAVGFYVRFFHFYFLSMQISQFFETTNGTPQENRLCGWNSSHMHTPTPTQTLNAPLCVLCNPMCVWMWHTHVEHSSQIAST